MLVSSLPGYDHDPDTDPDHMCYRTRFVASTEAGAMEDHKQGVISANVDDTIRTIIYTGRPMRACFD